MLTKIYQHWPLGPWLLSAAPDIYCHPTWFLANLLRSGMMQVGVSCTARVPSSSGQPGQGQTYFSSQSQQPLHWVIGSGQVYPAHPTASLHRCDAAFTGSPAPLPRLSRTAL